MIIALIAKAKASRFLRFGAVGATGFFVNEAALFVAHQMLDAGQSASWLIAFVPAVTFTWWGNRILTFADRADSGARAMAAEWARFVAANSLGAVANFVTYTLLIRLAPFPLSVPYVALAIGVAAGMVLNFALSAKLVFRKGQT